MPTITGPDGQPMQLPYDEQGMQLAAMLGQGGMDPSMGAGMPPDQGQPQFPSAADALADLFSYARGHPYMEMETDDTLRSQAMKWLSSMQDALAKKQKASEQAQGIGAQQKFMAEQRQAPYAPGRPF